jgi:hypothetical protein
MDGWIVSGGVALLHAEECYRLMSVTLYRPPKPEESQKNLNFNGKTIPSPGFNPGTSGLAVGSHNHCTIRSVKTLIILTEKRSSPQIQRKKNLENS